MRKLALIASILLSSQVMAQTTSVQDAPLDHLFVPEGFDNNDNIEFVVTGKFPNPCHTRNDVKVDVRGDLIKIEVTSLVSEERDRTLCEDLSIPFSEVVRVGSLQAGDYKIIVNEGSSSELKAKINVAVSSSSSVDDHLYAQVDYIELGFTGGLSGEAMLVGKSLSPCLAFDKVEYKSNGKDTVSIMPIMKKISTNCPEQNKRMEIPLKFNPRSLKNDRVLLFVRSVDGKSVHSFIEKK